VEFYDQMMQLADQSPADAAAVTKTWRDRLMGNSYIGDPYAKVRLWSDEHSAVRAFARSRDRKLVFSREHHDADGSVLERKVLDAEATDLLFRRLLYALDFEVPRPRPVPSVSLRVGGAGLRLVVRDTRIDCRFSRDKALELAHALAVVLEWDLAGWAPKACRCTVARCRNVRQPGIDRCEDHFGREVYGDQWERVRASWHERPPGLIQGALESLADGERE
jgi:hypothetical protein